jgi:hypothetical protein
MVGERSVGRIDMLVHGWIDEKTGKHRYFTRGSQEEREARQVVAHLLRDLSPHQEVHTAFCLFFLARLFDPTLTGAMRDIAFKHRREGNPGKRFAHFHIAREMLRKVHAGESLKGVVKAAHKKYRLSERTLMRIWSEHGGPLLERSSRR